MDLSESVGMRPRRARCIREKEVSHRRTYQPVPPTTVRRHPCLPFRRRSDGARPCAQFFEEQTDFSVCGEAEDGFQAIEMAGRLESDLIVLDVSMPRMNGLEAARQLRKIVPGTPVILFTLHKDFLSSKELAFLGVSAIVSKSEAMSVLADQAMRLLFR
jgi:CheY-like chemotaxis protein